MKTLHPRYTYTKLGVYYFSRSVPDDLRHMYSRPRIVQSLRTKSRQEAKQAAEVLAAKLNDHWLKLRLTKTDFPRQDLMLDQLRKQSTLPNMEECLTQYLKVKGTNRPKTFFQSAKRNVGYVVTHLGNRPLDEYESKDSAFLRDRLLENGLTVSSIQRVFASVRAVTNFSIQENGLECKNGFRGTYLPSDTGSQVRKPLNNEKIVQLQEKCREIDDDLRWLLALISDTGMRLAEAVGLLTSDIHLDHDTPYINLQPHAHRRLKTESSARLIPLVGSSLWATERIRSNKSNFCFPRYANESACNANSASAAANKWLKQHIDQQAVVHGLRHSFRDRLRATEAPSELIDQLGGWSKQSIGQNYGSGYTIEILHRWATKIELINKSAAKHS